MTAEMHNTIIEMWEEGDASVAAISKALNIAVEDVQEAIRFDSYKQTKWYLLNEGVTTAN